MVRSVNKLLLLGLVLSLFTSWGCGRKTPLKPRRTPPQRDVLKTDFGQQGHNVRHSKRVVR